MKKALIVLCTGLVLTVGIFGLSWLLCCGIFKLITLCFGWTFSWHIATGIWIIWFVLLEIFGGKSK